MTPAGATPAPSPTMSRGERCIMAAIGAGMGLCIGLMIWSFNQLTGQHHEVLVTTLALTLTQAAIGFFATPRKAAWIDSIVYFALLGFLDN